jgi:uncharacterized protein YueI
MNNLLTEYKKMSDEYIYILTNPYMPGIIKIGKTTTSVEQRVRELSQDTGVPAPFETHYAAKVSDCSYVEKKLHGIFGDRRINPNREFFDVSPERVVEAIDLAGGEDITQAEQHEEEAVEVRKTRKSSFKFNSVDIPPNTEICWARDNNKKAKVINDTDIEYDGKITSLSAAAKEILGSKWGVCGTLYWMYEGETLDERRIRLENE